MINHLKTKLQDMLEIDLRGWPWYKRFGLRCMQIVYACLRDLSDGQLSLQAMSLVYTTLITLVPLLAISFSVLKGFGVHNEIEPALHSMLAGLGPEKSNEVTSQIIGFVDNVKVGVLGAVGLALLLYAVIALMQKIEAAFNYIWRVGEDRTFAQRFSDYLSVLLMGPLLIFISAGFTTTVRNAKVFETLSGVESLSTLYEIGIIFLPWLVMAAGFTFFYVYMPNTKVKVAAAFAGGLIAAMLWKAMGFLFSSFIAGSANYVAIYAAFATLIVLMIWLYTSWLVILIGANVSFYVQYPRYLRVSREALVLSPHMRLTLGLSIMTLITKSHYKGNGAWNIDALSRELNVPILAIQTVVGLLEQGGILMAATKDQSAAYYPAIPLDTTPVQRVIDALEKEGRQGWLQNERMNITAEAKTVINSITEAREKSITAQPIANILGDNTPPKKTKKTATKAKAKQS